MPSTGYRSVQTMQLCSMKQGSVPPWCSTPRCFRMLQVFPTMSDCESCENTASCSQDVVERGFGSNAPRSKVASSGLTLRPFSHLEEPQVPQDGPPHPSLFEGFPEGRIAGLLSLFQSSTGNDPHLGGVLAGHQKNLRREGKEFSEGMRIKHTMNYCSSRIEILWIKKYFILLLSFYTRFWYNFLSYKVDSRKKWQERVLNGKVIPRISESLSSPWVQQWEAQAAIECSAIICWEGSVKNI